jgi:N-methylhydantoinase A
VARHFRGSIRHSTYERALLQESDRIAGPAIIRQMDSTTVLLDGQRAEVIGGGDIFVAETGFTTGVVR